MADRNNQIKTQIIRNNQIIRNKTRKFENMINEKLIMNYLPSSDVMAIYRCGQEGLVDDKL